MSTIPMLPPVKDSRMDQVRGWMSPLNAHVAALVLLLLMCVWLAVQLTLVGFGGTTRGAEAIAAAQGQRLASELAARPLRGVDAKLAQSQQQAAQFYQTRLPYGYADASAELGVLSKRTGVRLSRVQYVQAAAPVNGLTEVRIDAAVTGEYKPLALFLNGLERDRSFFLIQNVTLNGQQNGLVNLRLRIVTYLREPMPALAAAQADSGGRP